MNYLKELVTNIRGNTHIVTNIEKKVLWTDLKTVRFLKTIGIYLFRGSDGSRDHIVSLIFK